MRKVQGLDLRGGRGVRALGAGPKRRGGSSQGGKGVEDGVR